jgi:hypothetical protein
MSDLFTGLLRFAAEQVENAMSQISQQSNVVEEQALNPTKAIAQTVLGGAWVGDGATAFVDELSNLMVPSFGSMLGDLGVFNGNIRQACELMNQADDAAQNLVHGIADQFSEIF